MSIKQLISDTIPVLSPSDSVSRALEILEEYKLSGLPVVADDEYIGLATENTLMEAADDRVMLSESGLLNFRPTISALAHPFDAFSIMHEAKLPVLPVTDTDLKYAGCITKDSLISYIATHSAISNPGGVIVVEVPARNYSMYEIARICENEEVAILGMQLRNSDNGMLEVTLKLNRTVLDGVVASFSRHSYNVMEVYGKESDKEDILDKYNLLMNYINM
jgi:CBS domain-containing protein